MFLGRSLKGSGVKKDQRGSATGEICGFIFVVVILGVMGYFGYYWEKEGREKMISEQFEAASIAPPATLEQLQIFHGMEIIRTEDEKKVIQVRAWAQWNEGKNFYLHLSDRHYAAAKSMRILDVGLLTQLDQTPLNIENDK